MIASKAITGQASGTSHADPSQSPEEGTKGRAQQELPGPGWPQHRALSLKAAPGAARGARKGAGAILSWEKLLPSACTETGLEPATSAAGLPFCFTGEVAARQSRTREPPALSCLADSAAPA